MFARRNGGKGVGGRAGTPAGGGASKELRDLLVGNLEFTFRSLPLANLTEEKLVRAAEYFLAGLEGTFLPPQSSSGITKSAGTALSRQASVDPGSSTREGSVVAGKGAVPVKSENLFARARNSLHRRSVSVAGNVGNALGLGHGRRPSVSSLAGPVIKREETEESEGLELPPVGS